MPTLDYVLLPVSTLPSLQDLLIEYASAEKLAEAAAEENEEKFTEQTWMKLFLKYKQLKPT